MVDDSALILEAKAGSNAAKAALLKMHAGLIHRLIRRYCRVAQDFDDYYQVASLAFLGAISTFTPGLDVRFCTYFALAIQHRLQRYRTRDRIVVNPQWQQQKRLEARRQALGDFDGSRADAERAELDCALASHCGRVASLDIPIVDAADSPDFKDCLVDLEPLADDRLVRAQLLHRARSAAGELRPSEREAVLRAETTLAEIGARRGVSRERVRQCEARGLAEVRKRLARAGNHATQ